jgi:glucose-1-phosphate adenylyltransferase
MSYADVLALILGGGRGTRLWPLTKLRAKPAVPIGGKYRLVDIPLSNCLNSGIQNIAVLTQFNSVSLHRHIAQTYHFDFFHAGWVQILAAEQTLTSADWYQGTADAVRKQLFEIKVVGADDILILAGDHLYRMNYADLIQFHRDVEADLTIAVKPVSREEAPRFGILRVAEEGRITSFIEKPKDVNQLQAFISREDPQHPYVGSMGIYLFKPEVLYALLDSDHDDFGSDMIPDAIRKHRVFGYTFDGYWEDIGTIRAFYEANLRLANPDPPFSFHDPLLPIYTRPRFLPASHVYDVEFDRVKLADGCVLKSGRIINTIVGIRSVIGENATIEDTVLMGADYYEGQERHRPPGAPPLGIGSDSTIRGAIIDKNPRIGEGVRIEPFPRGFDRDEEHWSVRDGIVVVPKNVVIPDGTVIAPG